MSLNSPDYEDDDLDVPPTGPLNEDDILWSVEQAVSHVENRSVERRIFAAPDDVSAAASAKNDCRWWGRSARGGDIHGENKGLQVRRDGRQGTIPWLEVAQRVRGTYAPRKPDDEQVSLF